MLPFEIEQINEILYELALNKNAKSETLCQTVADYFAARKGFKVTKTTIGWKISKETKRMKHTIWDENINIEDWVNEDGEQMDYAEAETLNFEYLEDERMNLEKEIGEIVCIANLGLWNGRRMAHKIIGTNLSDILCSRCNSYSYNKWYSNGKDICHEETHHDGTNIYTYRLLKGETREEQLENLEKLASGELTPRRVGRYTKSLLPIVSEIYGW